MQFNTIIHIAVWINSMREAARGKAGHCTDLWETQEYLQRSCCRFKSSGILPYVLWQTVLDVSNDRNASYSMARNASLWRQKHYGHSVRHSRRTALSVQATPSPFSSEQAKLCTILHITAFTAAQSLLLSPSEKLTVPQPIQKFPACYGTWRFITVFTTARHHFLTWTRLIQSTPSLPNF